MEFFTISLLNGVSYGLLLFMLSSGLTLIFSMMGVLNFAHASFYMLGAYFAYSTTQLVGYWPALFLAPLLVAVLGAAFEKFCLRRVHKFGHVPELLITFGLSFLIVEMVQLVWGTSSVDYRVPAELSGPLFTIFGTQFPTYRGFMMLVALSMLLSIWLLLTRTRIGLIIQAALTHPDMAQALGHNVPRVFMLVFGGGAALAGLAGVIGGNAFVTEPIAQAFGVEHLIAVNLKRDSQGLYTGAAYADIVAQLVDRLGLKHFALGGNSMGGGVAWRYAVAHPDRLSALILVDASGKPMPKGSSPPLGFRLARIPVARDILATVTPRVIFEKSFAQSISNQAIATPAMIARVIARRINSAPVCAMNTPSISASISRKAAMYSPTRLVIEVQLAPMQIGIRNTLSMISISAIPSIPKA